MRIVPFQNKDKSNVFVAVNSVSVSYAVNHSLSTFDASILKDSDQMLNCATNQHCRQDTLSEGFFIHTVTQFPGYFHFFQLRTTIPKFSLRPQRRLGSHHAASRSCYNFPAWDSEVPHGPRKLSQHANWHQTRVSDGCALNPRMRRNGEGATWKPINNLEIEWAPQIFAHLSSQLTEMLFTRHSDANNISLCKLQACHPWLPSASLLLSKPLCFTGRDDLVNLLFGVLVKWILSYLGFSMVSLVELKFVAINKNR